MQIDVTARPVSSEDLQDLSFLVQNMGFGMGSSLKKVDLKKKFKTLLIAFRPTPLFTTVIIVLF